MEPFLQVPDDLAGTLAARFRPWLFRYSPSPKSLVDGTRPIVCLAQGKPRRGHRPIECRILEQPPG